MRIVTIIAQYLMAVVFLVFGMNHYLNFIPSGPLPAGAAGQFTSALMTSHYIYFVAFCEVVPGLLLLINRFVPLALAVLGPVIVNIFLAIVLMMPQVFPMAIFLVTLWILAAWRVRTTFFPLLQPRVSMEG